MSADFKQPAHFGALVLLFFLPPTTLYLICVHEVELLVKRKTMIM